MTKLSIIIPVFKVEAYIERCLHSIMSQKWTEKDVELECILIDDCSPDKSMERARKMIEDYQGPVFFVCLRHEKNRGLSAVRNTGLEASTGDYVFFMDSDDYLKPDSIETFANEIVRHPDIDIFIGQVFKVEDKSIYMSHVKEPVIITGRNDILKYQLSGKSYVEVWNKFVRRSLLIDNKIFFIEGIYFEDVNWTYSLFSQTQKMMLIPKITYVYDYNTAGIMAMSSSSERMDKVIYSFSVMLEFLLEQVPDVDAHNIEIEYLLYIHMQLTRGLKFVEMKKETDAHVEKIYEERKLLMKRALKSGRVIIVCFTLLLYNPLYQLFRWHLFRRHYYYLHKTVAKLAHLTDFLH